MTIEEFLLARIGEDEAVARMWYQDEGGGEWEPLEGRVLAECAAKRQIIKHCTETLEDSSGGYTSGALLAERVLSAMASTYAEHPDYQQDWTD